MIEVKTVLVQTETTEGRHVRCYFLRIVYDNGAEIARAKNPHIVMFPPDADYDFMLSDTNAHITTSEMVGMWPAIGAEEWARAVAHCQVEHTPEVKKAYAEWKAQQAA